VLERVRDKGRFYVALASSMEANTIKTDFNRFKQSILAFRADNWEADIVRNLMIRKKANALEFLQKSTWGAIADMRSALAEDSSNGTTDWDAKALRDMDEGLGNADS
jgi:hypothetical protein